MTDKRRKCPADRRRQLLVDQEYLCAYCLIPFGSVIQKGRRLKLSVVNWDHVLPFAYLQANPGHNWAATCMVCNQIKGADVFKTMDEIRDYTTESWCA